MLFMAVFHFGPEGGGPMLAARWQHGPTSGVTMLGSWVSSGYSTEGPEVRRTYVVFEAGNREQVDDFTSYLGPFCSQIEVRPVSDYLSFMRAYDARDPEQYPVYPSDISEEARRRQVEVFQEYIAAPTPAEAVRIWRGLGW